MRLDRRPTARAAVVAVALAALATTGCIFSKQVTNAAIRDFDVSRVIVGETTNLEVVTEWGPPAPTSYLGFLNPLEARTFQEASGPYRYVSEERRCASLFAQIPLIGVTPIPVAPILPFQWCDIEDTYVIALEFDDDGLVERVTRARSRAAWRPFGGGGNRVIEIQTVASPGSNLR